MSDTAEATDQTQESPEFNRYTNPKPEEIKNPLPPPADGFAPPAMETAELVTLMLKYSRSQSCWSSAINKKPNWFKVADRMGWTKDQLDEFRRVNAHLIECANEMVLMQLPDVSPPTDAELVAGPAKEIPETVPNEEQLAVAISMADQNFTKALKSLGLKDGDVETAKALQNFNKSYFKESMDMVSAGVLKFALKLQGEQKEIEDRLGFVRSMVREFGEFLSEDREAWVKEERLLMMQYVKVGELLNQIQDTWYRGAAYLAIVRQRMKGETGITHDPNWRRSQRNNRPGFRPSIIVNQDGETQESTP